MKYEKKKKACVKQAMTHQGKSLQNKKLSNKLKKLIPDNQVERAHFLI